MTVHLKSESRNTVPLELLLVEWSPRTAALKSHLEISLGGARKEYSALIELAADLQSTAENPMSNVIFCSQCMTDPYCLLVE